MNINYLAFLSLGISKDSPFFSNFLNNKNNFFYGFCIDSNKDEMKQLLGSSTLNKIYSKIIPNSLKCSEGEMKVKTLLDLYNIVYIDYIKFNFNVENYDLIFDFLKPKRLLTIDKIQFIINPTCDAQNLKDTLKSLGYKLYHIDEKNAFFILRKSWDRFKNEPNYIDLVFEEEMTSLK